MEVIQLSGYTNEEKLAIARKYLIPRQFNDNGISTKHLEISDDAVLRVIAEYTKEAGLRNLEREIASICRKVARKVAEGKNELTRVTRANIHSFLGAPKFLPEPEQEHHEIGVATGLAWTSTGGEILYVEASLSRGRGNLTLTGQLGDVMKESAQAAVSYARAHAKTLGIEADFYQKLDIHIHVPAGAIPERWSVGGYYHGNRTDFRFDETAGQPRCRHDGRDHVARPRVAHRRAQRKIPGGVSRRYEDDRYS